MNTTYKNGKKTFHVEKVNTFSLFEDKHYDGIHQFNTGFFF